MLRFKENLHVVYKTLNIYSAAGAEVDPRGAVSHLRIPQSLNTHKLFPTSLSLSHEKLIIYQNNQFSEISFPLTDPCQSVMDTLLSHSPPSPPPPPPPLPTANKRPCPSSPSSSSSPSSPRNPSRLSPLDQIDHLFDTLLSLSDSSPHSIDLSFDRLLDSRPSDADQSRLIDQALHLGSAVLEAAKRSARRRATKHNSLAWVLPPDLTIKVRFQLARSFSRSFLCNLNRTLTFCLAEKSFGTPRLPF